MSFHSLRPSPLSRRERRALGSTTGEQVRFVRDYNRRSWRQNRIFRQEPYPKAQDVFIRCGEANSDEDFNDLNVQVSTFLFLISYNVLTVDDVIGFRHGSQAHGKEEAGAYCHGAIHEGFAFSWL